MRLAILACLLLAAYADARALQQQSGEANAEDGHISTLVISPQDTSTVFSLGGGQSGSMHVTGMLQNFNLNDESDLQPINDLLERPGTSYLDVSWSNWVDQRLEVLDLFQEMLAVPARPRCPHMQGAAMDNGMVSYLASSRFGPAILTTYAQQDDGSESDFDWAEVNLPEGELLGRSYEDASLKDEMSADADKAFKMAELESRLLSRQPKLGYFGANLRAPKDEMLLELDGDADEMEPLILTHPNLLELVERRPSFFPMDRPKEIPEPEGFRNADPKQLAIFVLLLIGCCYVWTCLFISCVRWRRQVSDQAGVAGKGCDDLLVPLAPEAAQKYDGIQFATAYVVPEADIHLNGASLNRLAVSS